MQDDYLYYPRYLVTEIGLIPDIRLPKDWEELVSRFYKQGRQETVESYVEKVEKEFSLWISLTWDKGLLKNINFPQNECGLDLRGDRFQSHNLNRKTVFPAGMIAQFYIFELLKSKE